MKKVTKVDVIWNYLGLILNLTVNIFLLPLLFRFFDASTLGLWYVFVAVGSLVCLLDFGFSTIVTRFTSMIASGSNVLLKKGVATENNKDKVNYALMSKFIKTTKKIYLTMLVISFLILFTIGTFYISTLVSLNNKVILFAWIFYALGIMVHIYFSYSTALLGGLGAFKYANISTIVSRLIYIVITTVLLFLSFDILSMGFAYLVSGLLLGILNSIFIKKLLGKNLKHNEDSTEYTEKEILKTMLPNVSKQGIVLISSFLINRASTLLCASFMGTEFTSQYGLTIQLIDLVGSVGTICLNTLIPSIVNERTKNNLKGVRNYFALGYLAMWVISIGGCLGIILLGNPILQLLGYTSTLLQTELLVFLSIIYLISWNVSAFGVLMSTNNEVPYVYTSVISGVLTLVFSLIMLSLTNWGVWAILIPRMVVLIALEGWYWPYKASKSIKFNPIKTIHYSIDFIKGSKKENKNEQ